MNTDSLLNFFAEAGALKNVRRSGWWLLGIKDGESVAEHSFRTALIGFVLAKLEGVELLPTVMMCLTNDLHESRINDLHKVGHRYIDFKSAERAAAKEQRELLPEDLASDFETWEKNLQEQNSPEAVVARDADLLECMLQGKEYVDRGYKKADEWMLRPYALLKTESAKKLGRALRDWDSQTWWQHLKKLER
ncbi:MAG: HD domain-containing protein [Candidatus Omnitrophica bacterium]|nr:HD domain-containing protein [Candidatus Omnitrophota bacterium]